MHISEIQKKFRKIIFKLLLALYFKNSYFEKATIIFFCVFNQLFKRD